MREPVSVVIAAYNAAPFLGAALRSLRAQDWPVEAIVVNDGSTDDIHAVLRPHADWVTVVDQDNRGLSAARNVGIRRATGRYLLFLDADDILGDGVVEGQVRALQEAGEVGVPVCRTAFFSALAADGSPEAGGRWRRFPERLDIHLCHFNVAPPLAFLVRRDVALAAGGFDEGLLACEDHDFWLRVQGCGHAPFPGAEAVVWYRRHPGSMSSNLARQWRCDLELHLRISRLVEAGAPGFADARGTRLLACCAGMLLTLERLGRPAADALLPRLERLAGLAAQAGERDGPYAFFLARCLWLASSPALTAREAAALRPSLVACAERADRRDWLALDQAGLERLARTLGETLHDSWEPPC